MPAGYSPTSRVPREVPAANDSSIEQRRLRLWRRDAEASELSVPGTVESGRLTHQAARREQFALLPTPPRSFFYGLEESFAFPQLVASRQSEPQRLGVQRSFQGYGASAGAAPGLKDAPLVEEDEFTLQVDLLYTDGGEFSHEYSCNNMLKNDTSCYSSTKREGVNVVTKVSGVPYFTMTDVEAACPMEGYTSPLGQGCIFVSWDAPNLGEVSHYDNVTSHAEFQRIASQGQQNVHPSTPIPAGFFELSTTGRVKEHLSVPRSGRYILIKLLRSQHKGENVDVQYVGFRGLAMPHAFEEGSLL